MRTNSQDKNAIHYIQQEKWLMTAVFFQRQKLKIFMACAALFLFWVPVKSALQPTELPIPLIYQTDYDEVLFELRGVEKSVASSGCGVTCAAMVLAGYHGEDAPEPDALLLWAYEHDLYHGNGLSMKSIQQILASHGVPGYWTKLSKGPLRSTLMRGKAIIASMGKGHFGSGNHYILLRGVTEDGCILVADPISPKRSSMVYPASLILEEAKGSAPFWVPDDPMGGITQSDATPEPERE
jgi:hypothetical protein